jgi:hypothetical protein
VRLSRDPWEIPAFTWLLSSRGNRRNAHFRCFEAIFGISYSGDLRRADMACAKHAAGCGLTLEQIKNELVNGRSTAATSARRATASGSSNTSRGRLRRRYEACDEESVFLRCYPLAVALGRLGGLVRSEAKQLANRENGRKGGLAKSRQKTRLSVQRASWSQAHPPRFARHESGSFVESKTRVWRQ